jgi:phosphatidylinositol dimannoside acyltransferase
MTSSLTAPPLQRAHELEQIRKVRWADHALNNGLIFSATYHGVSRLPVGVSYGIGRAGTWLAAKTMRRVTSALADNLGQVFPERDERQLAALAALTLRSYAYDTIDFIRSLAAPPEALASRVVNLDREIFDRLLGRGKGILLVAAHFGSWELGAVILRKLFGYPVTMVAMAEPSQVVNRIRTDMRTSLGVELLEVRQSIDTPLQIRRRLAENRIVAMLLDRHLGRDRIAVDFFDREAHFLRTPALLSYLSGAPMLSPWIVRHPDGRFECLIDEPVWALRGGDRETTLRSTTQAIADRLAAAIRKYPHLWYHFYPFWESQPRTAT